MPRQSKVFWPGALIPAILSLAATALLTCALQGCASTNAVSAAATRDQKAYALYGTFVVVEEQAAKLVTDPNIPASVKGAVRASDSKAKPTADTLVKALHQYDAAVAAVKAGGADSALGVAAANLDLWIGQATTDISALVAAVQGTP